LYWIVIAKEKDEIIIGQIEYIKNQAKLIDSANKIIHPYAEKIKKAGEAAERRSNS